MRHTSGLWTKWLSLGAAAALCAAPAVFAADGWTETSGVTSTTNKVAVGQSGAPKIFTVKAFNNVTGGITSLSSMGTNIVLLDAQSAGYDEKTGIAAQFGTNALPAAVVFSREGTGWGTAFGIYTHNDDTTTLDQMAERLHISPNGRLDVSAVPTTSGTARTAARLIDSTDFASGGSAENGGGLDFIGKYHIYGYSQAFANVKGIKSNATGGNPEGIFVVSVSDNSNVMTEAMRVGLKTVVLGPPNAGVDQYNPRLFVRGNAVLTGSLTTNFQDVAEWVEASEPMEVGTVVIVDPGVVDRVQPSSRPYDTRVAGVVSAQPGLILGVASDEKEMIATTGRVKVRVDATRAPIVAGDLLVTSDKPGVAMKSLPVAVAGTEMHRPGTLIGKALEPLAEGQGEILVLLSLQ